MAGRTIIAQQLGQLSGTDFPIMDDTDGYGGYRVVQDITARNNIPANRRKSNMKVATISDGKEWVLQSDLTSWVEASSSGTLIQFIFSPGNPSPDTNKGVFSSWSNLVTVASAYPGVKTIFFDDGYTPITIPSGVWDFGSGITIFQGSIRESSTSFVQIPTEVDISDGTSIKGVRIFQDIVITVENSDAAHPVFNGSLDQTSQLVQFILQGSTEFNANDVGPILGATLSGQSHVVVDLMNSSGLEGGPCVAVYNAGQKITINMHDNSELLGGVLVAPGATEAIIYSASVNQSGPQPSTGSFTVINNVSASLVKYTDSSPVLGSNNVQGAIDILKSKPAIGVVSNFAQLASLNDNSFPDGYVVYVQSLRSYFYRKAGALVGSDGITYTNSNSGTAVWYRNLTPNRSWALPTVAASWFIDSSAGNDENAGTSSGTALKTLGELSRRLNLPEPISKSSGITINMLTSTVDDDFLRLNLGPGGFVNVTGTTTVNSSASVTAVTNRNKSTNQREVVTAALSWVQPKLLHNITQNAYGYVAATTTGGASQPVTMLTSSTEITTANGDSMEELTLPKFGANVEVSGGPILFRFVRISTNTVNGDPVNISFTDNAGNNIDATFDRCIFEAFAMLECPRIDFQRCLFTSIPLFDANSTLTFNGCVFRNILFQDSTMPNVMVFTSPSNYLIGSTSIQPTNSFAAGRIHIRVEGDLAIFDSPNDAVSTITLGSADTVEIAGNSAITLWGSGSRSIFNLLRAGARVSYNTNTVFYATTGSNQNWIMGTRSGAWTALPSLDPYHSNSISANLSWPESTPIITFANLAALDLFDTSLVTEGCQAYISTLKGNWRLKTGAVPGGADGYESRAALGSPTKHWDRIEIGHHDWSLITTWEVNTDTGSDENDGLTTGTPLKSIDEIMRRIGELPIGAVTVNCRGTTLNMTRTIKPNARAGGSFTINGVFYQTGTASTVSVITRRNSATNTSQTMEATIDGQNLQFYSFDDSNTPYLLVTVAGATAVAGWIIKDAAGNAAYVRTTERISGNQNDNITVGAACHLELPPKWQGSNGTMVIDGTNCSIILQNLWLKTTNTVNVSLMLSGNVTSSWCTTYWQGDMHVNNAYLTDLNNGIAFNHCHIPVELMCTNSKIDFNDCIFFDTLTNFYNCASTITNSQIIVHVLQYFGGDFSHTNLEITQIGSGVQIRRSTTGFVNTIWGSGSNTSLYSINDSGTFINYSGTNTAVTSNANAFSINLPNEGLNASTWSKLPLKSNNAFTGFVDGTIVDSPEYCFANRAAITSFNNNNINGGTRARTIPTSSQAYSVWEYSPTSTVTVDGTSAIATLTGVGRWLRVPLTDMDYVTRSTWQIDPIAGDDGNVGSVASPIKTLREWWNRTLGKYSQFTTMTLNNAIWPTTDPWVYPAPSLYGNASLGTSTPFVLLGIQVVSSAGTFTSPGTNISPGTADGASTVTDSARTWATSIGSYLSITSGTASGATCPILAEPTTHVARVGRFCKTTNANFVASGPPTTGDTYNIISYTTIDMSAVTSVGEGIFVIQYLNVTPRVVFSFGAYPQSSRTWWGNVNFTQGFDDSVDAAARDTKAGIFFNCLWQKGSNAEAFAVNNGFYDVQFGGSLNGKVYVRGGTKIAFYEFLCQGAGITVAENGTVSIDRTGVYGAAIAYDVSKSGIINILNSSGVSAFGTGNTLVAQPRTGGIIHVASGYTPLTTGTTEISFFSKIVQQSQAGTGTLTTGTVNISATVTANSKITATRNTPSFSGGGQLATAGLSIPQASRTSSQFTVNAVKIDGTVETTETSTFDWSITEAPVTITTWAGWAGLPTTRLAIAADGGAIIAG